MKTKFLFAGLACALTLGALAPTSARAEHESSGSYVTRMVGRDRCGYPVYQKVWVPSCNHMQPPVCASSGYSHGSSRYSSRGNFNPQWSFRSGGSSSGHSHTHGR